ncbi:hypothetical protein F0562_017499 [Nyssa sinensis]|uniref:Uncharacterized protein n=1 Tax=Nyssa sinensis TaxID=561372 RepID=A0A5J4ZGV5_9ASTE|nr:hypothetical protein F0562_017499 [Nyssa sinensis]
MIFTPNLHGLRSRSALGAHHRQSSSRSAISTTIGDLIIGRREEWQRRCHCREWPLNSRSRPGREPLEAVHHHRLLAGTDVWLIAPCCLPCWSLPSWAYIQILQDLWERLVRAALRRERTGSDAYGRPGSGITGYVPSDEDERR